MVLERTCYSKCYVCTFKTTKVCCFKINGYNDMYSSTCLHLDTWQWATPTPFTSILQYLPQRYKVLSLSRYHEPKTMHTCTVLLHLYQVGQKWLFLCFIGFNKYENGFRIMFQSLLLNFIKRFNANYYSLSLLQSLDK